MANQYVNKVVQSNGATLMDITDTTAQASDVRAGMYFYLATGQRVPGSAVEKYLYQDSSGYICISDTLPDISASKILAVTTRAEIELNLLADSNNNLVSDSSDNQILSVTRK